MFYLVSPEDDHETSNFIFEKFGTTEEASAVWVGCGATAHCRHTHCISKGRNVPHQTQQWCVTYTLFRVYLFLHKNLQNAASVSRSLVSVIFACPFLDAGAGFKPSIMMMTMTTKTEFVDLRDNRTTTTMIIRDNQTWSVLLLRSFNGVIKRRR